jgi:hypothetical protein
MRWWEQRGRGRRWWGISVVGTEKVDRSGFLKFWFEIHFYSACKLPWGSGTVTTNVVVEEEADMTVVEDEMIQLILEERKNQREKEQQGKRPKRWRGRGEEDGGHTSSSSSTHKKAVRS